MLTYGGSYMLKPCVIMGIIVENVALNLVKLKLVTSVT